MRVPYAPRLCFFLLIVICRAAIPSVTDCSTPSSQGKFIDGTISPCDEDPCTLVKGHNTSISIKFISTEVVKAGKIVVHGIIGGVPIPFSLPDNNLCHFLKPGCEVQPYVPTTMVYSLYVKETYPSIHVNIKWELVDELGVDLVCIKFPAKLESVAQTIESGNEKPIKPQIFELPRIMIGNLRRLLAKVVRFQEI